MPPTVGVIYLVVKIKKKPYNKFFLKKVTKLEIYCNII